MKQLLRVKTMTVVAGVFTAIGFYTGLVPVLSWAVLAIFGYVISRDSGMLGIPRPRFELWSVAGLMVGASLGSAFWSHFLLGSSVTWFLVLEGAQAVAFLSGVYTHKISKMKKEEI